MLYTLLNRNSNENDNDNDIVVMIEIMIIIVNYYENNGNNRGITHSNQLILNKCIENRL